MALGSFGEELVNMNVLIDEQNQSSTENTLRGIFERPEISFVVNPRLMEWILNDSANPLNHIVRAIPDGAVVLDIGAGNGVLARLLRAVGRKVIIDAIEPDLAAREFSGDLYRKMYECNLETFLDCSVNNFLRYDIIVMADVIEHLPNPEPYLCRLKALLSGEGFLAINTPNIAFLSVRLALLVGRFDYVDSGILERTHLRFFTRKTLQQLFSTINLFPIAEFHCLRDPFSTEIPLTGQTIPLSLLLRLTRDELASVYQFLFFLGTEQCSNVRPLKLGTRGRSLPINYGVRRTFEVFKRLRELIQSRFIKNVA